MDEYISRQAFKEKYLCCGWLPEMAETEFDDFPAADVVEVRHAHWKMVQNGKGICGACDRLDSIDQLATHCRYCGARMDKES